MKSKLLITALGFIGLNQAIATATPSVPVMTCNGQFALCASSSTTLTGKTIRVKGKVFAEGRAVCPVLTGKSIGDKSLLNNSCTPPEGYDVWSLFSDASPYPQPPTWRLAQAQPRTFTTTAAPGGGMSNMWSFPCKILPKTSHGVRLAECFGPMNESPWTYTQVLPGSTVVTQAPKGAFNPVAGNEPIVMAKRSN